MASGMVKQKSAEAKMMRRKYLLEVKLELVLILSLNCLRHLVKARMVRADHESVG